MGACTAPLGNIWQASSATETETSPKVGTHLLPGASNPPEFAYLSFETAISPNNRCQTQQQQQQQGVLSAIVATLRWGISIKLEPNNEINSNQGVVKSPCTKPPAVIQPRLKGPGKESLQINTPFTHSTT